VYLKRLELENYRNYTHINLSFDKNTILIVGDNGQGKTNLLESIYFLSTGRSHRTYSQDELINWDKGYSILRAYAQSKKDINQSHLIEIELKRDGQIKIRVDKVYRKRKSDFTSIIPSVFFSPDDLSLIKAGPVQRRSFLDGILDNIDSNFSYLRLQYQKILNQRNTLLKNISSLAEAKENPTLEVWNDNLVKYGAVIIEKRLNLVESIKEKFKKYINYFFNNVKTDIFYTLSWEREDFYSNLLNIGENENNDYNFSGAFYNMEDNNGKIDSLKKQFYFQVSKSLSRDISFKTTTIGPHRDDLVILFNGKNLRTFGSQGQKRVASLSLKLCELSVLKERLGKDPILLLDDVLSELDLKRKKLLIKLIDNRFQTFITTTNIGYLKELDTNFGNKYLVKNNKITSLV